ncbi:MAG: glycosyltransferase family 9 protein [Nitrospinae bacterium]|nr:glycosyltransferase family 9 protein [Nitrospinota bacterium]MBL7020012.1 glycosyltransferase family 9 protein [Nitrospinaceae bacterium]
MEKILIVSSTGMGDCLWGTPGIRALKKTFPSIEIDLVVNCAWRPLFDFNPHLNRIFEYQDQWYRQPFLGMRLLGRYYDAILIFHANRNFRRMMPWFRSLPVWCIQGFNWVPESNRVKMDANIHGIERRLLMLEKFGVKPNGGQMEIFFDSITLGRSQQILQAHDFSPGEYVYLNLGAAVESRRWMVERFSELASRILKITSWNIILGGGPNEKKRALTILNQLNSSRAMEVCSQPILVNAAMISKAGLMVTSDTGPMHIGLAVGTPVVALFGTISPTGSGPHEVPDHLCRVIKIDLEEKNCAEGMDPGEFHFGSITVDTVWEQVEKVLEEKSNS